MHDTAKTKTKPASRRAKLTETVRAAIARAAEKRWGKTKSTPASKTPGTGTEGPLMTAAKKGITEGKPSLTVAGARHRDFDPATVRRSPFNREHFDEEGLDDLVADVKIHGILQAGIVRLVDPPEGRIVAEIIAGERRWRAATKAGVPFPATVRNATDREVLELQAIENMLREDLNPMDEARKFQQLQECYEKEGMGREEATEQLHKTTGKGMSTIYQRLALLKLPDAVVDLVQAGTLPASHASLLTKIKDPARASALAQKIVKPKAEDLQRGAESEARADGRGVILGFRSAKDLADKALQHEKNLSEYESLKSSFAGVVLPLKESDKLFSKWGHFETKDYIQADDTCYMTGANYRHYSQLWKKAPAAFLARKPDMAPLVLYKREDAEAAVKTGGKLRKERGSGRRQKSPREMADDARQKERQEEFKRLLPALIADAEKAEDTAPFWKFLAQAMIKEMSHRWGAVSKRRALVDVKPEAYLESLGKRELRGLCVEFLLAGSEPNKWQGTWTDTLAVACEALGHSLSPWAQKPKSMPTPDAQNSEEEGDEDEL